MTCGLVDIGCHLSAFLAPAWAFVLTWWWIAFGVGCMLLGSWLGPRGTLAVLTIGLGVLIYDRTRNRKSDIDYETGEPSGKSGQLPPKQRKTLGDLFGGLRR